MSWGGGIKQLESDEGSGVYLKLDNGQGYVSFKDQTINNGAEVKLSEFALKTDIPAGVDLANYTGEVNLSEQKSFTFGGGTYNRSSIFSLASFDKDLFPDIPEEASEYIKGPYISYTLDFEDMQSQTVLALAGLPGFYTKTPSGSAFLSLDKKASLVYNQDFEDKQQRSAEVYAGQRTSGGLQCILKCSWIF